jgi:hypothetical protein
VPLSGAVPSDISKGCLMIKRFLLPAAACCIMLAGGLPAFAQNKPLSVADAQRQAAIFEAHKSDLAAIDITLGLVEAAVLCTVKDAKWGMTYRPIVLRVFDQFTHEIGLSDEAIYALRQDMESNAHKVAVAQQCDKLSGPMVDNLTVMLNGLH